MKEGFSSINFWNKYYNSFNQVGISIFYAMLFSEALLFVLIIVREKLLLQLILKLNNSEKNHTEYAFSDFHSCFILHEIIYYAVATSDVKRLNYYIRYKYEN